MVFLKKTVNRLKAAVCAVMAFSVGAAYGGAYGDGHDVKVNADDVLTGDINNDGSVNAADEVLLKNYLLGKSSLIDSSVSDINGDGKVNIIDEIFLKNKLLSSGSSSKDDSEKTEATVITLQNNTAKISGTGASVTGSVITVSEPGTYSISGKLSDGQIIVDVDKKKYPDGKVELSLEGAEITSSDNSPVYIASIDDECVITVKKETENVISDGTEYTNASEKSGALYSKDKLKIKGKGKLTVNGNCSDGIVCKDSLKIFNGNITVNAVEDGIKGKDSVKIGDADDDDYSNLSLTVNAAAGDGIKSTNDTDEDKGKVTINGGTVKITAFADGIQAETSIAVNGGDIDIYTYQGSEYQSGSSSNTTNQRGGFMMDGNPSKMPEDMSAKGLKSLGSIDITGGNLVIDSSDDAIHAAGNITVTGGVLELRSADDGMHSDADLVIGAGTADTYNDVMIYVPKCYEGIEGINITQNSGTVIVYSDDDGFNAAGGADGSGMGGPGGWDQGGWNPGNQGGWNPGGDFGGGGDYSLNLLGGLAFVSSADGDHDGFDSNGDITIDGAITISNGNEAYDCDGTKKFVSGTYVELSGGGRGFGFGRQSEGFDAAFTSKISAAKGDRITIRDSKGNLIVSFEAGKAATQVSVGSKTVTDGTVTVGGTVSDGKALPVTGGCQQISVGK